MQSIYTNTLVLALRSVGRKLGLNRPVALWLQASNYEEAFDKALLASTRANDVVWDIGANVGYYTLKLAGIVGTRGEVVAFEPHPLTADELKKNVAGHDCVKIAQLALGGEQTEMTIVTGNDQLRATSNLQLVDKCKKGPTVSVRTGDSMVARGDVGPPQIIKIDVEGFELDVLQGMPEVLQSSNLRAVFIEVHFGCLEARGLRNAPKQIEDLLRGAGLQIKWLDPSHLVATRV